MNRPFFAGCEAVGTLTAARVDRTTGADATSTVLPFLRVTGPSLSCNGRPSYTSFVRLMGKPAAAAACEVLRLFQRRILQTDGMTRRRTIALKSTILTSSRMLMRTGGLPFRVSRETLTSAIRKSLNASACSCRERVLGTIRHHRIYCNLVAIKPTEKSLRRTQVHSAK